MNEIPVEFKGDWLEEEKKPILDIIVKNDEAWFDAPMYNYWSFNMLEDGYIIGKRLTWDMGTFGANTVNQMVLQLKDYYK